MDKESRLAQAITDRAKMADEMDATIEQLKQEIAEEQKPKLRHGDVYVSGSFVFTIARYGGRWRGTHADGSQHKGTEEETLEHISGFRYSHNQLDDLKAMSEDVTEHLEFPYKDSHGDEMQILMSSEFVHFRGNNGMVFNLKEISTIILKLRQMEATLRRQL